MMYTRNQNQIRDKSGFAIYLLELKKLTGVDINGDLLLTEDIEEIREKSSALADKEGTRFIVDFSEKDTEQFRNFVRNLNKANDAPVYVWTNSANSYGLYKATSINSIDFSFSFDVNPDGIIVLLTEDLNDRLLLDFYRNSEGREILELELYGKHWKFIPLDLQNSICT